MSLHRLENLSTELASPLNQAVHTTDGAQFALVLGLLSEAMFSGDDLSDAKFERVINGSSDQYNLNLHLGAALQNRYLGDFYMLNSLYFEAHETPPSTAPKLVNPESVTLLPKKPEGLGHIIDEIETAKRHARVMSGVDAERISLRTGMVPL